MCYGALVAVYFIGFQFHHPVAPLPGASYQLEACLLHYDAYFGGAEWLFDGTADPVQDMGRGDKNTFFARYGTAVMGKDQFLFQIGDFEVGVTLVDGLDLFFVEPIPEPAFPKRVCLCIYTLVVWGVRVGVVNGYHIEWKPAAASARIGQELLIIGGSAETGDVRTSFFVMSVCHAFVHYRCGGHGLDLV